MVYKERVMAKIVQPQVKIIGTGSYLPDDRITNADLEKLVDTNNEWIVQRTGIEQRRKAAPNQCTSDLAYEASKKAIANAGLTPADIDQIIVATVSPDTIFPSTACRLQHMLGCRPIMAFDMSAACSGFVYAINLASSAIISGSANHVLVVGAECLTRFTDYTDRTTCILFGDGAGAVVLGRCAAGDASGIIDMEFGSDGSGADLMELPGIGSKNPPTPQTLDQHMQYIKLQGRAVYKHAITSIVNLVHSSLERCEMTANDVDLFIPHQMNLRIIESSAKHLDVPLEKWFVNIQKYANTSSATIPVAMDEARQENRLHTGDKVMLVAFGGGMTWGSVFMVW